jgi:hypothetical protein
VSAVVTAASVPTPNGSRYLQQLCKHWAHKFAVSFDAQSGDVPFPNGAQLHLEAGETALMVNLTAPDVATAETMQGVVASHLAAGLCVERARRGLIAGTNALACSLLHRRGQAFSCARFSSP